MKRGIFYLLTAVAMTLILSSCDHKDLCFEHPHKVTLRIAFDWRDAPDADATSMHVCFYPADGKGKSYIFNLGRDGDELHDIEVGRYHLLCYNNTSVVQSGNTHAFDAHELFTRDGDLLEPALGNGGTRAPRVAGTEDQSVVICPDRMWGNTATDIVIDNLGVSYVHSTEAPGEPSGNLVTSREYVITLFPHELTCTYTYEIRNVKNLKHATDMCASLSGMAGSLRVSSEEPGRKPVTLPFAAKSDKVSTITGTFHTFGHHEDNAAPHRMALYVWMDDGKKYAYGLSGDDRFDVTSQVHGAPDRRRVHLVIDGLDLPTPIENGSGFNPSVDDWDVVEEDIIM